ncbi:MAG: glycosyltransferase family 2 protein [Rhodospirillaceae bacterium]|nr:glycosyltransferase family 2 protein [Rhodospirillaceae bacterium]
MTAVPLVSVVVPAYRPGPWLAETLASIVAQHWQRLEIILIDDGNAPALAPPNSGAIPLRLVRQDHAGVSAARNTGLAASAADFIAFLDADDLWLPDSLSLLMAALADHGDCAAAHGRCQRFSVVAPGAKHEMLGGPFWGFNTGTLLFRREAIARNGGFDETIRFGEDFEFLVRLQEAGLRRHLIDGVVMLYRRGHGSTTERAGLSDDFRTSMRHKAAVLAASLARRRATGG